MNKDCKNTLRGDYTAEYVNKHTHLFANVLHHEFQLFGVFTLTIEQVPPQSCSQHTVIRQDSLQTHSYCVNDPASLQHTHAHSVQPQTLRFYFFIYSARSSARSARSDCRNGKQTKVSTSTGNFSGVCSSAATFLLYFTLSLMWEQMLTWLYLTLFSLFDCSLIECECPQCNQSCTCPY